VRICIAVAAVASFTLLSACQNLYKFGNANLRAVGAQAIIIPPTPLSTNEVVTVTAQDATLEKVASAIRDAINGSAAFQSAGISAAVPEKAPDTVIITYAAAFDVVWSGTATTGTAKGGASFQFASSKSGGTTLTLGGTVLANDKINLTAGTNIRDSIAAVVNQSQQACAKFLGGLVLAETSSNTSFDILSTITSALATVFSPLSTVHSLTASTTILTGSKTAIDADIYAKASVANFATAIQSTYYADMSKYVAGLSTADATTLDWQIEMYKISVIHDECALAPAQASIAATMQPTQAPPSQPAPTQPATLTVSFTVTDAATLEALAEGIATQINGSSAFRQAGISAGAPIQAGNDVTLALTYASGGSIIWSANLKPAGAGEQITFPTATTIKFSGTVKKGDAVTISDSSKQAVGSTTPPAATPPAVTPGHKVNSEPPKS
jgi:hypothetical protein